MRTPRWEHFEHEADMGVRGCANTVDQAFEQAALAMTGIITDPGNIDAVDCIDVECVAPDYEVLLVDWLNEVIYQMAIRKMLFVRYQVSISDYCLKARLCGETANREKHKPAVEIKGATFTELKVNQTKNSEWVAQCVVDV